MWLGTVQAVSDLLSTEHVAVSGFCMQAEAHSTFHFQPPGWAVPFSIIYPSTQAPDPAADASPSVRHAKPAESQPDAHLAATRALLHDRLGLPGDPQIRVQPFTNWHVEGPGKYLLGVVPTVLRLITS